MSLFSNFANIINDQNNIEIVSGTVKELDMYLNSTKNHFDGKEPETVSTIYTCIEYLTNQISRPEILIYKDNNDNIPDYDDPLYALLNFRPHPNYNRLQWMRTNEYWVDYDGNAYSYIHRDRAGNPIALEPIHTNKIDGHKININGELLYRYVIDPIAKTYKYIHNMDICHFKGLTKGIFGMNPVTAIRLQMSTTQKALMTADHMFENNIFGTKAIEHATGIDDRIIDKGKGHDYMEDFISRYAGMGKDAIIAVPYGMKLTDIPLNLDKVQFIETMKYNKADIAGLYGVPVWRVGIWDYTKFNNIEQMQLDVKGNTLEAKFAMYAEELSNKLIPIEDRIKGRKIRFDSDSLVEIDYKTKADARKIMIESGQIKVNDARRKLGQITSDEGDNYLMSTNVQFADQRRESADLDNNKKKNENK